MISCTNASRISYDPVVRGVLAVVSDEEKARRERRVLARASWISELTMPEHAYGNGDVYHLTAKDCRSLAWFLQEAVQLEREVAELREIQDRMMQTLRHRPHSIWARELLVWAEKKLKKGSP